MKTIWAVVIAVVVTGAVVGGTTYYFVNKKAEQNKKDLNNQITLLNQKIQSAQAALTATPTSSASATTDETAGWQTYTSKDYGYLIKFPQNLYYEGNKVQQYPGESGAMDLIISDIKNMGIQDILSNEKIHIDVSTTESNGKTLDQFVNDYKLGGTISDKKEITLGPAKAIQFIYQSGAVAPVVYTFVLKDNFVYIIRATNGNSKDTVDSENYTLMKNIVGTFRFSS